MPESADAYVYILVHIPKTGGQSLRDHFIAHMAFHREFIHLGPHGDRDAAARGLRPFADRPRSERRAARVILGHDVTRRTHRLVPGKTPRHITFLRDPAAQIVSHYNFDMQVEFEQKGREPISFDEWYDAAPRNGQLDWILHRFLERSRGANRRLSPEAALALVNRTLEEFWLVGCTERLDEQVRPLLRELGLPLQIEPSNVSGVHHARRLSVTPELRERLAADNPLDTALYRQWSAERTQAL